MTPRPSRLQPLAILTLAALFGAAGLWRWPFPERDLLIRVLGRDHPCVVDVLRWTYATLWFTTPALLLTSLSALAFIFLQRPRTHTRPTCSCTSRGFEGSLS